MATEISSVVLPEQYRNKYFGDYHAGLGSAVKSVGGKI